MEEYGQKTISHNVYYTNKYDHSNFIDFLTSIISIRISLLAKLANPNPNQADGNSMQCFEIP